MPINHILMMKINQPNSLTHFSMNNQTHEKLPYSRWFIGCNILSSKFTPFLHKDFPYPIPTFLPYGLKSNLSLKCPSLEIFPDNFLPQNSNTMQVKFQLSKKNNAQAMPMPLVRRCVLRVETYLASITIQTWSILTWTDGKDLSTLSTANFHADFQLIQGLYDLPETTFTVTYYYRLLVHGESMLRIMVLRKKKNESSSDFEQEPLHRIMVLTLFLMGPLEVVPNGSLTSESATTSIIHEKVGSNFLFRHQLYGPKDTWCFSYSYIKSSVFLWRGVLSGRGDAWPYEWNWNRSATLGGCFKCIFMCLEKIVGKCEK